MGSDVLDSNIAAGFDSDTSINLIGLSRKRSDSGASSHSGSTTSEEKGPTQEVARSGSTCSSDSEAESRNIQTQPNEDQVTNQEQPTGAVSSLRHRPNGLLNGSTNEKTDLLKQKVAYTTFLSDYWLLFLHLEHKDRDVRCKIQL